MDTGGRGPGEHDDVEEQVEQAHDGPERTDGADERPVGRPERRAGESTGHPGVDAVVDSLEHLDDLPAGEHVVVYESAHTALRDALNRAGDD